MHFVHVPKEGRRRVELLVGWLPTCIGANVALISSLQRSAESRLLQACPEGEPSEDQLAACDAWVVDELCGLFPTFVGLRELLNCSLRMEMT